MCYTFHELAAYNAQLFQYVFHGKTFCYSQVHSPKDVTKQTIAVNTGRVLQSYVNHTYLLFEKEPPLVYSNPASLLQCKRRCT